MQAKTFRRLALAAWVMQALIVFSGAAVRLTEAGLGCEDWPTCNEGQFLPERQIHGLIEFGNRVISGLVALSAVAVLFAAYRRMPRRADLIRYAWMVMAGTVAQVVLGGITVLLDLHPIVVSVHFLVSMGLLAASQLLWLNAGVEPAALPERPLETPMEAAGDDGLRGLDHWLARAQLALATMVLVTGTVVTGTGPNSGDTRADRLDFELETVARVHSVTVWLLLATLVALALRLAGLFPGRMGGKAPPADGSTDRGFLTSGSSNGDISSGSSNGHISNGYISNGYIWHGEPGRIVRWMVVVAVAQGALGYLQFALGVPPLLVEFHIVGAVAIWSLAILLMVRAAAVVERPEPIVRRSQPAGDLR